MDDIFETADDLYESNPEKGLALYSQAVEEFPEDARDTLVLPDVSTH